MGSILCARSVVQDTYNPAAFAGNQAPIYIQPLTSCISDTAFIRYARPDGGVEGVFGFVQTQYAAATADFVIQGSSCGYSEKFRIAGNFVGIGTSTPCSTLDVYRIGSGATGTGDNLILRGGNNNNLYGTNQIRFGYSGGIGYSHAIKTRHNSGTCAQNAFDFFIWTNVDCVETVGTKNVMTLDGTGNVGISTCTPNIVGFTGTVLTVNGTGNYQGLEIGTSGTTRMTVVSDGSNGYVSTRQAGMCLIFETGAASEKMRITSAGNVGINTASPSAKLAVEGSATDVENVARFNNQVNCTTRVWLRNSNHSAYWGLSSTSTADPLATGMCAGAMTLGFGNDFPIQLWNGATPSVKMTITSAGNMGIGTGGPSYKLHVNGTFYAAGSSQDYKEGICKYDTDSCMFMKLKPVTYQYKDEFKHLGKELKSQTQIGLIAEEVAEVAPELAILVKENDNDVVRNVDYEKLTIVLLSEVQKLRKELDDLKTK